MKPQWYEEAWEEYLEWQSEDKKTLKKINDNNIIIASCKGHYDDK